MTVSNIVVGIDFSPESEVAAHQALEIARHTGASITLLHVGALPERGGIPTSMIATANAYNEILAERLAKDRARLNELRERLTGQGVVVSQMVHEGFADSGISDAATELGADLIVVGSHGRTGVKRFLLGSVAERVVRLFPGKVMVAKGSTTSAGFRHILVPTDFSDGALAVLDAAVELAAPDAKITLLHCWHLPPMGAGTHNAPLAYVGDVRKDIAQSVKQRASAFYADHRTDHAEVEFVATEAPAAIGIQRWLEDHECDLVVMGSHGRRGVRRFILGSIAEVTVRHASCSILVVHAEKV